MFTVLLADDEPIIRRGLKKLIDWEGLGYCVSGETGDGRSTLEYILENLPDVAVLDIRLPEFDGLEVMRRARDAGYQGKVIILSGYSDFAYAQKALRYNAQYYLSKPVDGEEMNTVLKTIAKLLTKEQERVKAIDMYRNKATETILKEMLCGTCDFMRVRPEDINMDSNCYQVAIYEKYHRNFADTVYHFSELLRVANKNQNSFVSVEMEHDEVIILKSEYAIQKFQEFLEHFDREMKPQKGSPLDSLFITYGKKVYSPEQIQLSYRQARRLMERRFFCREGEHTLGYSLLDDPGLNSGAIHDGMLEQYTKNFTDSLQAGNRERIRDAMQDMTEQLYYVADDIKHIKLFLTDLFLRIKEKISIIYQTGISFPTNAQIIDSINGKYYLYEIMAFFIEQFELVLRVRGMNSKDAVIDNVVDYIKNNYRENIRLEGIAAAFGYNSSYLGQLFTAKMGCSFNAYLDQVRIYTACQLLEDPKLKVYEVAEAVGYRDVDYFYTKFKKYMKISPIEHRRAVPGAAEDVKQGV